jgi:hypothetical protein
MHATSTAITIAQTELSAALDVFAESHGGVVAQVERANHRFEYSLESRAKTMDALLHQWKSELIRMWIPMVAEASMLIACLAALRYKAAEIELRQPRQYQRTLLMPTVPNPPPKPDEAAVENPNQQARSHGKANFNAHRER